MRLLILIGSLSLLLVAAGCRRDPALHVYIDEINAEKRLLENRLNELQFELEAKEKELERYRRLAGDEEDGSDASRRSGARSIPRLELPPPRRSRDREDESEEESPDLELTPPMIEPGEKTGDRGRPHAAPASTSTQSPAGTIARLVIDVEASEGVDLDRVPGDDGMRVVLQTLDGEGRYRPLPAPIEVELFERGNGRSVATWRFTAEEVEISMARADATDGFALEMRLPRQPRSTRQHRLVVRYRSDSGPGVEADAPIELVPNVRQASRWTPRRDAGEPREARATERPGPSHGQPLPANSPVPRESLGTPRPNDLPSSTRWRPTR